MNNAQEKSLCDLKNAVDAFAERWIKNYVEMLAASTADIKDD